MCSPTDFLVHEMYWIFRRQEQCVATAHRNCLNRILHARNTCCLQSSMSAMSMALPRQIRTVNQNGCSNFTASVNLLALLSVFFCNSKMNPHRIRILFVGARFLLASSTCIAAIDSNSVFSTPEPSCPKACVTRIQINPTRFVLSTLLRTLCSPNSKSRLDWKLDTSRLLSSPSDAWTSSTSMVSPIGTALGISTPLEQLGLSGFRWCCLGCSFQTQRLSAVLVAFLHSNLSLFACGSSGILPLAP